MIFVSLVLIGNFFEQKVVFVTFRKESLQVNVFLTDIHQKKQKESKTSNSLYLLNQNMSVCFILLKVLANVFLI